MKYDLVIKEEAIVDMQQAYDYYEERKTGLGERFFKTLWKNIWTGFIKIHYTIKSKENLIEKFS